MKAYDHKKIERKWQEIWKEYAQFTTRETGEGETSYLLIEFPYPSGDGLHVGHVRPYTALDVVARKRRAEGRKVLFPIGWDAFGLPTENYAIKTGIHPKKVTEENTARFKEQIEHLGISFDWSREINTSDPKYYKWTQWIFLQFYKKGLAYKDKTAVNWCLSCKIGLANEEVVDGKCERCGGETEKREKEQWMLAITKYADKLLDGLEELDYPESVKAGQRNWIGRSEGAEINFELFFEKPGLNEHRGPKGEKAHITVFTTRPDTLFGATFMVLAPEHQWVTLAIDEEHQDALNNRDEVIAYIKTAGKKSDLERQENKEKTGVELKGVKAINPATNEKIPIFVADYVTAGYGTGAIMSVPAHDERDHEFAKKHRLPIRQVIVPCAPDTNNPPLEEYVEVERETVIVFLKNKETDKYALLKWHGSLEGITTGIMGGVEDGNTPEEAILNEIKEEAAIPNAKITKKLNWVTCARYCASHKKENRRAITYTFLAEVDNLSKQGTIPNDEARKHTLIWVSEKEVLGKLVPDHQKYLWQQFKKETAITEEGLVMHSGKFNGMSSQEAGENIIKAVDGEIKTTYKLRDWVFSRQRYWGEPIPMIDCEKCGWVPVPEEALPVELPDVEHYKPTDDGESPLAAITDWVNTTCPKCSGPAKRETDTMPNWAGSSWYYLRYLDPHNNKEFADAKKMKEWLPVDWYNGGMEHTTLHLLYSRFWHKFLYDQKLVPTSEPYAKRTSHGLVLAKGGEKMSKSKGNVVNPDEVIEHVGADTLRIYEMFMGPFEQAIPWNMESIAGPRRFLERVWKLSQSAKDISAPPKLEQVLHQTIKKVGEDIENIKFNTAVSALMIFLNELEKEECVPIDILRIFLQLLAPFAPHIAEELWQDIGEKNPIHEKGWPSYDPQKLEARTTTIVIQIEGKVRAQVEAPVGTSQEEIEKIAYALPNVQKYIKEGSVTKTIYIPNRLLNIVL